MQYLVYFPFFNFDFPPKFNEAPCHEELWESGGIALDGGEWLASRPGLPPGKYPLDRSLDGPHSLSGRYEGNQNFFPLPSIVHWFLGRMALSHWTDWAIPATQISSVTSKFIVEVIHCSAFRTNYNPSHVWANIPPLPIYVICSPTQNRKTLSSVYIPVIRKTSWKESVLEGHTQRVLTFTDPGIMSFIALCYKSHGFFFLEVRKVFCGGGSNVFIPKIPAWGLGNWNGYMEHRGQTMMWGAVSPEGRRGSHMMIHIFLTTLPSFHMAFVFFLHSYALIQECPHSNMTL
jgi:hypothetical protein